MHPENAPESVTRVLLLGDDGLLRDQLLRMATAASIAIRAVRSPEEAIALVGTGWQPSVVVVDLFLPTSEVLMVGRALRSTCAVPVLVVVPGADDGMQSGEASPRLHVAHRPLAPHQVLDHIERLMTKRVRQTILTVGPLTYIPGTTSCTLGQQRIELGRDEGMLLERLMLRPGQTITRDELFPLVSGFHRNLDLRIVDVYLVRLMVKIGSRHGVSVRLADDRTGYLLATDTEGGLSDGEPLIA